MDWIGKKTEHNAYQDDRQGIKRHHQRVKTIPGHWWETVEDKVHKEGTVGENRLLLNHRFLPRWKLPQTIKPIILH